MFYEKYLYFLFNIYTLVRNIWLYTRFYNSDGVLESLTHTVRFMKAGIESIISD